MRDGEGGPGPEPSIPIDPLSVLRGVVVHWVLPLAGLLLVLLAYETFFAPKPAVQAGALAPDFSLPATEGDDVTLSALQGQRVLLNFWGTWCAPCRRELPALSRFAREHPAITVLGLAVDSGNLETLARAKDEFGIGFTVLQSADAVELAYGVSRLPTTFLLNENGEVEHYEVGPVSVRQLEGWLR